MFLQSIESRIHSIGMEWIYLFCTLCFGIIVRIATPPYQVADEVNHFCRAWQIMGGSKFRFVLVGLLLLLVELLISGVWIDWSVYARGAELFTGR